MTAREKLAYNLDIFRIKAEKIGYSFAKGYVVPETKHREEIEKMKQSILDMVYEQENNQEKEQ